MEADARVFGDRLVRVLSRLAGKLGGRRGLNAEDRLRYKIVQVGPLANRHARRGDTVITARKWKKALKAAALKKDSVESPDGHVAEGAVG